MSGCFPKLTGQYDGLTVWAALYVFVIAPAANGKGGMGMARKLAYPTHAARVTESKEEAQRYEAELDQYNQQKRTMSKARQLIAPAEAPPAVPKFRQLYVPANSSAASIVGALSDNDGHLIMCETEGDTLAGPLKQDWGNFSDILRKAFHHEPITSQRKTGREHLEVNTPVLATVLTATMGQVPGIIPSAENGLFSRFLFYYCNPPQVWRSVAPDNGRGNLSQHFDQLAERVTSLIAAVTEPVSVELTPGQWQQLNNAGAEALADAVAVYGEEAGSIIKRLGLSTFRLAMLFTLLRQTDFGAVPAGRLVCADDDFANALLLADVYRRHALALFARMPREAAVTSARNMDGEARRRKALELSQQGTSNREIARRFNVSEGSIRNWLKVA
ncbi:DUF3987 domain-containing protein [Hymenobacter sediminicola]|uniref:DUF3987 domain-containing protein n=1 Tax=Hymenobacter sediminicola TaxID=2761579 RepID=A0A7G7W778_9BACT|nr:DUF3987 domain-containing protein [Hymenobacter sediminicola]QNH62221.1 DUF3987 domain-containing protein [Hymenobacter sediminicola]